MMPKAGRGNQVVGATDLPRGVDSRPGAVLQSEIAPVAALAMRSSPISTADAWQTDHRLIIRLISQSREPPGEFTHAAFVQHTSA